MVKSEQLRGVVLVLMRQTKSCEGCRIVTICLVLFRSDSVLASLFLKGRPGASLAFMEQVICAMREPGWLAEPTLGRDAGPLRHRPARGGFRTATRRIRGPRPEAAVASALAWVRTAGVSTGVDMHAGHREIGIPEVPQRCPLRRETGRNMLTGRSSDVL